MADNMIEDMRKMAYIQIWCAIKNLREATIIEHDIWSSVCHKGSLHGIPVWTYGESRDSLVFETDRPEVHYREAATAYSDKLQKTMAIIKLCGAEGLSRPMHEIEGLTEYGAWRDSNLATIRKAKTILEEREETTDAFIACRKCKSNAVDTEQKQTRAADEPMTIFCMCRKCGSRWRIE